MEDDLNDVLLVEMEFERASPQIRLRVVNDGSEAISYLERSGLYADRMKYPVPDVILLDLKMPKIGGFDFLQWLRTKSANHLRLIPVIVMSSSAMREDVERAYALGANSYLVKPMDWHQFRERIKALGIYWAEHVEMPEAK